MTRTRNAYNVRELAGAFGDLGTFIPFLVGYLTISKMDPVGVLVAFGIFKIFVGLYFRTPVPIQPMKAIGTAAITHAGVIAPGAILASGLFTGAFWLLMGVTGAVTWIARLTSRSIVQGLVLGLGLGLMLEGVKLMDGDWLLAVAAMALTFVLLSHERIPAMLLLLAFGAATALAREPGILAELIQISVQPRLPHFAIAGLRWEDMVTGVLVLGLPQVALTLGNAIVATVEENNALFPDRPITVRTVATLFKLFPASLLGVILLFGGLELATGALGDSLPKQDRYVLLITAGIAMWNMGAGYLAGLLLHHATRRGVVRL